MLKSPLLGSDRHPHRHRHRHRHPDRQHQRQLVAVAVAAASQKTQQHETASEVLELSVAEEKVAHVGRQ